MKSPTEDPKSSAIAINPTGRRADIILVGTAGADKTGYVDVIADFNTDTVDLRIGSNSIETRPDTAEALIALIEVAINMLRREKK